MTEEKPKSRGRKNQKQRRRRVLFVLCADIILAAAVLVCAGILIVRKFREAHRPQLSEITAPDWYTQDFFVVNPYSRPGTKRTTIDNIVIHYVANPGTTARQNWNYFNSLAQQTGKNKVSASSHYIIGIDGEILQGIPLDEIAYANYPRNDDTVSIECCHPDNTGEFSEETEEALVKLTAWLCRELKLTEKDVIRHYDIIGKNCPKYYVEHEDAWEDFIQSVKKELKKRKES